MKSATFILALQSCVHMSSAFAPSVGISTTSSSFIVAPPNRISSIQAATNDYGLGMPLSPADAKRIGEMRERIVTIPILIMDTILPGQALEFSSGDQRLHNLIDHVLKSSEEGGSSSPREIGIVGSHGGNVLSLGVTVPISKASVTVDPETNIMTVKSTGLRRFEVQGEPWLDYDTFSFYFCQADITDRHDPLSEEQIVLVEELSDKLPVLVKQWLNLVENKVTLYKKQSIDVAQKILKDIGPMPDKKHFDEDHIEQYYFNSAMWVASLMATSRLDNLQGVDIRAAMLACRNDLDRLNLAIIAVESGIRRLQG
mmetsp:Transcript_33365/g.48287  ORF Transcript_33365/g.48287 Transcript_33365/m.48287 type:complete len:313 (+) Transcript_33365:122-1060(+)